MITLRVAIATLAVATVGLLGCGGLATPPTGTTGGSAGGAGSGGASSAGGGAVATGGASSVAGTSGAQGGQSPGAGGQSGSGLGADCSAFKACCSSFTDPTTRQACADAAASYEAAEAMNPASTGAYEQSCATAVMAYEAAGFCGASGATGAGGNGGTTGAGGAFPGLGPECKAFEACCSSFPDPTTHQQCEQAAAAYASGEAMNPSSVMAYEDSCAMAVASYKQAGYCGAGGGTGAGGSAGGGLSCMSLMACCEMLPGPQKTSCEDAVSAYIKAEAQNPSGAAQYEQSCATLLGTYEQTGNCH